VGYALSVILAARWAALRRAISSSRRWPPGRERAKHAEYLLAAPGILWFGLSEKAILLCRRYGSLLSISINVEPACETFRESTPWPAAISVRAARGSFYTPLARQPPSSGLGLKQAGPSLCARSSGRNDFRQSRPGQLLMMGAPQ